MYKKFPRFFPMVNSIFERALESTFLHYTYIIKCISLCFMILYVHCINNSPANVPTTLKVREFEFEKKESFQRDPWSSWNVDLFCSSVKNT